MIRHVKVSDGEYNIYSKGIFLGTVRRKAEGDWWPTTPYGIRRGPFKTRRGAVADLASLISQRERSYHAIVQRSR